MNIIGNIFWWIFGGLLICISWFLVGILCFISIIGIPFGIQAMKIARFSLFPFGKEIRLSTKSSSLIGNILWILLFGWELALVSLITGFAYFVSIIGIPLALQSFKLAKLALFPFGAKF